jgi:hypothetical protein
MPQANLPWTSGLQLQEAPPKGGSSETEPDIRPKRRVWVCRGLCGFLTALVLFAAVLSHHARRALAALSRHHVHWSGRRAGRGRQGARHTQPGSTTRWRSAPRAWGRRGLAGRPMDGWGLAPGPARSSRPDSDAGAEDHPEMRPLPMEENKMLRFRNALIKDRVAHPSLFTTAARSVGADATRWRCHCTF